MFCTVPDGKQFTTTDYEEAMDRLMTIGVIKAIGGGPKSMKLQKLVRVPDREG